MNSFEHNTSGVGQYNDDSLQDHFASLLHTQCKRKEISFKKKTKKNSQPDSVVLF